MQEEYQHDPAERKETPELNAEVPSAQVTLRTGFEMPLRKFNAIYDALQFALDDRTGELSVMQLVTFLRGREVAWFDEVLDYLTKMGWIDYFESEGRPHVHQMRREVLLAASDGTGFDITFVDPLQSS